MKRRRFILEEVMESCRLLPAWMQYFLFSTMMGISMLIVPVVTYFFLGTIIFIQIVFILLLIQKNIVYRKTLKNIRIINKVIWIHGKKDKKEKYKKMVINLVLIAMTIFIFFKIQDLKLLVINGLFCFLFFLKFAFYVPLISVRVIEDEIDSNRFIVIDKGLGINTEIDIREIKSVKILTRKITVQTIFNKIEIPIDFQSNKEMIRVTNFLKRINKFQVI